MVKEAKTQIDRLHRYITENYSLDEVFTTEKIYYDAQIIGLNPNNVGSVLHELKKRGILTNTTMRKKEKHTNNCKLWRLEMKY